MIKPFWIPLVGIMIIQLGCKEQQNSNEQIAAVKDTIVRKAIQIKFKTLTSDAVKELNELPEFKPFKAALDSLNHITPNTNDGLTTKLSDRALNFEELLPKKFKTSPIIARLKVLVTETGMLDQKMNQGVLTMETFNTSKKRIKESYDNFVKQVNELYLEIPSNIAKELLENSKVLSDSVPLP